MNEFRQFPLQVKLGVALLAAFAAFVVWDQWHWWSTQEEYAFGYLVPLFVGYVLFERWPQIVAFFKGGEYRYTREASKRKGKGGEAAEAAPEEEVVVEAREHGLLAGREGLEKPLEWVVTLVVLCAFPLFVAGSLLRAASGPSTVGSLFMAAAFATMLMGGVFLMSSRDNAGNRPPLSRRTALALAFLFPALVWLISAPMVSAIRSEISLFLMGKVTVAVVTAFEMFGEPLERAGNTIILPNQPPPDNVVGVAEACSGIRSLIACLFAGSFMAAVFLDNLWKKVALVGMAMVFAFIMNVFRSLFLTYWAWKHGAESIGGSVHDITGYAVLGMTCLGLAILLPIFNFRFEYDISEWDDDGGGGAPGRVGADAG